MLRQLIIFRCGSFFWHRSLTPLLFCSCGGPVIHLLNNTDLNIQTDSEHGTIYYLLFTVSFSTAPDDVDGDDDDDDDGDVRCSSA